MDYTKGSKIELWAFFPVMPTDPLLLKKFLKQRLAYNSGTAKVVNLSTGLEVPCADPLTLDLKIQADQGVELNLVFPDDLTKVATGAYRYIFDSADYEGEVKYKFTSEESSTEGTFNVLTVLN